MEHVVKVVQTAVGRFVISLDSNRIAGIQATGFPDLGESPFLRHAIQFTSAVILSHHIAGVDVEEVKYRRGICDLVHDLYILR